MQSQETVEVIAKLKEERDRWQAACKAFGTWMMDESFYDSDGKYLERVLPVLKAMRSGDLDALEKALGIGGTNE
jgi:hypothetical protein